MDENSPMTFAEWNFHGVHCGRKFTHDFKIVKLSLCWLCGNFSKLLIYQHNWFPVNTWRKEIFTQSWNLIAVAHKLKELWILDEYVGNFSPTTFFAKVKKTFLVSERFHFMIVVNVWLSVLCTVTYSLCSWHFAIRLYYNTASGIHQTGEELNLKPCKDNAASSKKFFNLLYSVWDLARFFLLFCQLFTVFFCLQGLNSPVPV